MNDRKIFSAWQAAALASWIVGIGIVALDMFLKPDDVGHIGLILCMAGALFNVRGWLCKLEGHVLTAFEVGRDVGQIEGTQGVRRLQ